MKDDDWIPLGAMEGLVVRIIATFDFKYLVQGKHFSIFEALQACLHALNDGFHLTGKQDLFASGLL